MQRYIFLSFLMLWPIWDCYNHYKQNNNIMIPRQGHTQLAFYVNLHRAVIGPSATLTGRWRPDIDLRRMLTGTVPEHSPSKDWTIQNDIIKNGTYMYQQQIKQTRVTGFHWADLVFTQIWARFCSRISPCLFRIDTAAIYPSQHST